jgi:hypothetical protein
MIWGDITLDRAAVLDVFCPDHKAAPTDNQTLRAGTDWAPQIKLAMEFMLRTAKEYLADKEHTIRREELFERPKKKHSEGRFPGALATF